MMLLIFNDNRVPALHNYPGKKMLLYTVLFYYKGPLYQELDYSLLNAIAFLVSSSL